MSNSPCKPLIKRNNEENFYFLPDSKIGNQYSIAPSELSMSQNPGTNEHQEVKYGQPAESYKQFFS